MKILKPGKVEQVKLSCPRCGCVFVVSKRTEMSLNCATKKWIAYCPQRGCEHDFELCEEEMTCYEEPAQPKESDRERLIDLFNEGKDRTNFIDFLIANGVTFREG